jgi:hypothetical protein
MRSAEGDTRHQQMVPVNRQNRPPYYLPYFIHSATRLASEGFVHELMPGKHVERS